MSARKEGTGATKSQTRTGKLIPVLAKKDNCFTAPNDLHDQVAKLVVTFVTLSVGSA